ncbi:hypothetical protein Taro_005040 [Colocasia esculenta]|uniref:Glycosyltransferase n=1 Tax=Colocasia esculenta TaxID=4460 RepID=A0A843TTD7_COLES|nr:hypothetical protein [Colocasia esculenta]
MANPHAVMVPCPTPGHINPMLHLAKLLHSRGFHITFVVTQYNHQCLLSSGAPDPLLGFPRVDSFRVETIPDGLPMSGRKGMQYIADLEASLRSESIFHLRELMARLGRSPGVPAVTCVVGALMSAALQVADELGVPKVLFWTTSACGFMGTLQCEELIRRGYVPLKDESCLTNGYLETELDWIPGMIRGIRLRDITRFIRTTDPEDPMLEFERKEAEAGHGAWGVVLNTFEELEADVLAALRRIFPRVYTLGPLSLLMNRSAHSPSRSIRLSLWKEDTECLAWLDGRETSSVLYVNFGSITVLTSQQLVEFALGLANSGHPFLWVIRPDLVAGESATLPESVLEETAGRGFLTSWCPQEEVLAHPSVGGFLTHGGWNSMLESILNGVPMLCWPFFAEQPTNCRYACKEWGVAMEIEGDVQRGQVEGLVREMMGGPKGNEMRRNTIKWKERAEEAAKCNGSSHRNMERFVLDLVGEASS